jgi:tetratricopeptide (TPR) repeat protein
MLALRYLKLSRLVAAWLILTACGDMASAQRGRGGGDNRSTSSPATTRQAAPAAAPAPSAARASSPAPSAPVARAPMAAPRAVERAMPVSPVAPSTPVIPHYTPAPRLISPTGPTSTPDFYRSRSSLQTPALERSRIGQPDAARPYPNSGAKPQLQPIAPASPVTRLEAPVDQNRGAGLTGAVRPRTTLGQPSTETRGVFDRIGHQTSSPAAPSGSRSRMGGPVLVHDTSPSPRGGGQDTSRGGSVLAEGPVRQELSSGQSTRPSPSTSRAITSPAPHRSLTDRLSSRGQSQTERPATKGTGGPRVDRGPGTDGAGSAKSQGQASAPNRTDGPTVTEQNRASTQRAGGDRQDIPRRWGRVEESSRGDQRVVIRDSVRKTPVQDARDRLEAKRRDTLDRDGWSRDGMGPRREIVIDQAYRRGEANQFRWKTAFRPTVAYRDRTPLIEHRDHYTHMFYDAYNHPCHQLIWPSFQFGIWYRHGYDWTCRYVYPYYHRKYVFVSLGGWWPIDYCYASRYYWYGYHPYEWYGYDPVAHEVRSDTYNYYTYNYYGTDAASSSSAPGTIYGIPGDQLTPRQNTGAAMTPNQPTIVDTWFEDGVKDFEAERYSEAAEKFRQGMEAAQNDQVIPFAYAQALFADGRYADAAEALRKAVARTTVESAGVFYPRGLYKTDDALYKDVDRLMDRTEGAPGDTDLQLLLGYHLLGVGEAEQARAPLEQAAKDARNKHTVDVLTELLRKTTEQAGQQKGD